MQIVQPGCNARRQVTADASGVFVDAAGYRAFYEAAGHASRHVLISGWQFDSGVPLLRTSEEESRAAGDEPSDEARPRRLAMLRRLVPSWRR